VQKFHTTDLSQKSNAEDMASIMGRDGPAFPLKGLAREVLAINFRSLSKDALNDAENQGAALMAIARKEALRRSKQEQSLGWDRQGPHRVNGGEVFDHKYTLCSGEGRRKYVSEPYQFTAAGIHELLEIQQQGWEIEIKAGDAMHFPGDTVAISFERQSHDG